MSMLTSENAFLSSLQPHTLSTTYALPSDNQLGNGSAMSDGAVRARRVQEQIKMKMAEKGTLPRQNGKASQYAMSDYGGSSTMKYSNYSPSYSSKSSYMYSGSKTLGPRVSARTEFSSRSAAPDITQFQRMSVGVGVGGGGGGGGGFYREEMHSGGFQGTIRQNQMDRDDMSVHSLRNPAWMIDNSDAGSLISERDGTFDQQYSQSGMNGYDTQLRQGGSTMSYQTVLAPGFQTQEPALSTGRRSLSGTLSRSGGLGGGGTEIIQQQSFKGPAHRTINRIANRNRMSVTSMSGSRMTSSSGNIGAGGDRMDSGFLMSVKSGSHGNLSQQRQGGLMRSTSMRSVQSVGGGMDIYGQADFEDNPRFEGIHSLDVPAAISYLRGDDTGLHALGSAYLQHICYNEKSSKEEVRALGGTEDLVRLFNSPDPEVRRYSTGAVRNLIFQHADNKQDLIDCNGIAMLNEALVMEDDELHKNITGILWNLSAKDNLKDKLKMILPRLTEKILVPLTAQESEKAEQIKQDIGIPSHCSSETEILLNTLGCLRNLSSGSEKVRKEVRETKGLVESLVGYIRSTLDTGKVEEKGAENTMCTLRNLSYRVYEEMPPSMKSKMDGTTSSSNTVGCFSPNSSKIIQKKSAQKSFSPTELAKFPKGIEWLCHPKIVHLYNSVIKSCEINAVTREAAIGALQNITSGQDPWAKKLSCYMVNDYKMLPNLLDHLRSERTTELRSLSGLLRSLSSHADTLPALDGVVKKLPEGNKDVPNVDVLVNLCGVLNNMVARSFDAAKRLTENSGLERLMNTKTLGDEDPGMVDASRSARVVLRNIYNYRKLHRIFRRKGYTKKDFCDDS